MLNSRLKGAELPRGSKKRKDGVLNVPVTPAPPGAPTSRKASKEVRHKQLIEATIDCIAQRGYAGTTLAEVADGAGLSRGIVNFHFHSKEKLLIETLRYLSNLYDRNWQSAIKKAGKRPAEQLWALAASDFSKSVCNRRYISAWSGLRAEASSRPTYQKICAASDKHCHDFIIGLCTEIKREGGYEAEADMVALGFDGLVEGLWLQLLMQSHALTRTRAKHCVLDYFVSQYPKHFNRNGPIPPDA